MNPLLTFCRDRGCRSAEPHHLRWWRRLCQRVIGVSTRLIEQWAPTVCEFFVRVLAKFLLLMTVSERVTKADLKGSNCRRGTLRVG